MKKTVLYESQAEQGAKMISFGGWQMPGWYSSMKDEHLAVRNGVGMFDISHMGLLALTGETVQSLVCNVIASNKMTYAMVLNHDGGILDDVMVCRRESDYLMVVNASNKDKIMAWIKQETPHVGITDLNDTYAFIAVQGPRAIETLTQIPSVGGIPRFGYVSAQFDHIPIHVLRTGYTGEDGVELMVPLESAVSVWNTLLASGVSPCGLASRDTLRIEAGLPLYGQELSEKWTPRDTRYSWVVKGDHDFIGKAALDKPSVYRTLGLALDSPVIARPHYAVCDGAGTRIGEITSGTRLPETNASIAMAMIRQDADTTDLSVLVRKNTVAATVVSLPFK